MVLLLVHVYTQLQEIIIVHDKWDADFAKKLTKENCKSRYFSMLDRIKRLADRVSGDDGLNMSTLPPIKHVLRSDFDMQFE